MLRAKDVVTAWARRLKNKKQILAVLIVCAGIFLYKVNEPNDPSLEIKGQKFSVETAKTDELRQKGLSGRESLDKDKVMVFEFEQAARRCFWMKDMKFNIDMVWLNSDKKVIAAEHNVSPDTYPQNFCHDNAKYVVEFNANTAKELGLQSGDTLKF